MKYAKVILPLKLNNEITYSIPDEYVNSVEIGSRVEVILVNRKYIAIVYHISDRSSYDPKKVRNILSVLDNYRVDPALLEFWKSIAKYYMCTIGEVYRAAYPAISGRTGNKKKKEEPKNQSGKPIPENKISKNQTEPNETEGIGFNFDLPDLSPLQQEALDVIQGYHSEKKNVLLNGVTGSGKTEIYMHLIAKSLKEGKNVLYMLPEKAVSRQLSQRLKKIFPDRMLFYHSGQTPAQKRKVIELLTANQDAETKQPYLILGLRSALFLPFDNLGLIIVDEEHDSSYKQNDPAPRYNGRDAALFLASLFSSRVVMGSATPSFESLYNIEVGKLFEVRLTEKYHKSEQADIVVIDMLKERKKRAVKGPFSKILLKQIDETLTNNEQILVFRARRAYSPIVQCAECGYIPKCPNCNIHLSYHKYNDSLSCHYCNYSIPFQESCPECTSGKIIPLGAGTERIEEELKAIYPDKIIERFDADTTKSKREEERILKEFSERKIDILVGTQMISKGFDFSNLTLVVVMQGETMTSMQDFRSDEKALQQLLQLSGRAGRREQQGTVMIQTTNASHPIFSNLESRIRIEEEDKTLSVQNIVNILLQERGEFGYPPYSRMVKIIIKDRNKERAVAVTGQIEKMLNGLDFSGPGTPNMEKIMGEYIYYFWIKLPRNKGSEQTKEQLLKNIDRIIQTHGHSTTILTDVDPL